jgi:hypothetical protein
MYPALRYRLAHARLADLYCQILRDAAMDPAVHYDLTRARIADVYDQVQRNAETVTASRGRSRHIQ